MRSLSRSPWVAHVQNAGARVEPLVQNEFGIVGRDSPKPYLVGGLGHVLLFHVLGLVIPIHVQVWEPPAARMAATLHGHQCRSVLQIVIRCEGDCVEPADL